METEETEKRKKFRGKMRKRFLKHTLLGARQELPELPVSSLDSLGQNDSALV